MSKATEYLDILQKKEPQMFQEPLQKSLFTEKDIGEIEHKLKYAFPKPYKDFLMAYKMPEKCVVRVYYS
ncbi:MAG: SMI1/KNR4 family protein, partial [Lachnospiraceae bacterium]|nr:SMI1/KNR4 family protein [Lachnospiraceae bacterium]